jgi:hypothetical protein
MANLQQIADSMMFRLTKSDRVLVGDYLQLTADILAEVEKKTGVKADAPASLRALATRVIRDW